MPFIKTYAVAIVSPCGYSYSHTTRAQDDEQALHKAMQAYMSGKLDNRTWDYIEEPSGWLSFSVEEI
jgi:hypothetical protein